MSYRIILAPVTGSDSDRPILNAAMTLAGPSKSHIQVLFLHRDPQDVMVPHIGYDLSTGMIDSLILSANEQIGYAREQAKSCYTTWLQETGVTEVSDSTEINGITSAYVEAIGDMSGSLARAGRMADVICMVRSGDNAGFDEETLIQTALLDTGKPVVLVPSSLSPEAITSIAIAWNGTREAARAVSLAMPLLEAADSVSVVAGTCDQVKPEDVTAFAESLERHGINAHANMFALNGADITKRLQDEAHKGGAQLLVMGAYSHSRLRESVFGGVTNDIVNAGQMPVLMAH